MSEERPEETDDAPPARSARRGLLPETFEQYLERSAPYFAAVREAGDLPWFEDPEKRATALRVLGLPPDTPPMELRRALWERRNRKAA